MQVNTSVNSKNSVAQANRTNGFDASSTGSSAARLGADMNFDSFLKMLTTQLKNQDPLNPMDGTAFTAQIAQFSQLEQSLASNKWLEKLASGKDFGQQALAVSYIGKEALIPGGALQHDVSGRQETFSYAFNLDEDSTSVPVTASVKIKDAQGQVVRTMDGGLNITGANDMVWDGKDDDGNAVPAGTYTLAVDAADPAGNKISVTPSTYAHIAAVQTDGGEQLLISSDGRTATFSEAVIVREPRA